MIKRFRLPVRPAICLVIFSCLSSVCFAFERTFRELLSESESAISFLESFSDMIHDEEAGRALLNNFYRRHLVALRQEDDLTEGKILIRIEKRNLFQEHRLKRYPQYESVYWKGLSKAIEATLHLARSRGIDSSECQSAINQLIEEVSSDLYSHLRAAERGAMAEMVLNDPSAEHGFRRYNLETLEFDLRKVILNSKRVWQLRPLEELSKARKDFIASGNPTDLTDYTDLNQKEGTLFTLFAESQRDHADGLYFVESVERCTRVVLGLLSLTHRTEWSPICVTESLSTKLLGLLDDECQIETKKFKASMLGSKTQPKIRNLKNREISELKLKKEVNDWLEKLTPLIEEGHSSESAESFATENSDSLATEENSEAVEIDPTPNLDFTPKLENNAPEEKNDLQRTRVPERAKRKQRKQKDPSIEYPETSAYQDKRMIKLSSSDELVYSGTTQFLSGQVSGDALTQFVERIGGRKIKGTGHGSITRFQFPVWKNKVLTGEMREYVIHTPHGGREFVDPKALRFFLSRALCETGALEVLGPVTLQR